MVWCQTTSWHGAAGIAQNPLPMFRAGRKCDCVSPKQVTKKYTTKNRRLCRVDFFAVRAALVTTARRSSECRPDDKAEATSRVVALCGAKQGPQGFVAEPQKPAAQLLGRIVAGIKFSPYSVQMNLSRAPRKKKRGGSGTELPTMAPRHHGTTAPWHHSTTATQQHGTTAPRHHGTTAQELHSTTASLGHNNTITPRHHGTTARKARSMLDCLFRTVWCIGGAHATSLSSTGLVEFAEVASAASALGEISLR